ncbi:MAG TPA: serine/threonine-protein kinase [Ktedonobacteraceae bacterium]|nr:serine/threonine-protein kinase [Ktedonobacteraceae bacterium]
MASDAAVLTGNPEGHLTSSYLLHSRYSIVKQIGTGGFGAVYKAKDTLFSNRLVAIKEMNQDGLSPQELAEANIAFEHEALLLTNLIHPNLPRIHDHFSENGCSYVVMDFIDGTTLEDYLSYLQKSSQRLPIEQVLEIGIQLCTVLNYLHMHEPPIIFRDIKPANIMRTIDNHVYLIDFGIARHFKPGKAKDTIPLGSRGYAAPEQYGKAQTTPQSDIYGLGATLHELLTGDDPSLALFHFETLQLGKSPIAAQLNTLIKQMVEMEISKRPTSMTVVQRQLQGLLAQQVPPKASPVMHRRTFMKGCAGVVVTCGASIGAAILVVSKPNLIDTLLHHPFVGNTPAIPAAPSGPAQVAILRQSLYTYRGHTGSVTAVAWSPNGQMIASSGTLDGSVQVWDANGGDRYFFPELVKNPIARKLLSRESMPDHAAKARLFKTNSQRTDALAWLPDNKRIAAALGNDTVDIWNIETGQDSLSSFNASPTTSPVANALALSPDGRRIATIRSSTTIQVYSVAKGTLLYIYEGYGHTVVLALAWSPNGKLIASAGTDHLVRIWSAATGKTYMTYPGHSAEVLAVAWSPDGRCIASGGSDGIVQVWDVATGNTLFSYRGHSGAVNTIVWQKRSFLSSRPLARIASAGDDATVQVWWFDPRKQLREMAQQSRTLVYRGHSGPVTSIAWSPDGQFIASGSEDGTVQVWQAQ